MSSAQERADMDVQYEEWKGSPAAAAAMVHAEAKTGLKAAIKKLIP